MVYRKEEKSEKADRRTNEAKKRYLKHMERIRAEKRKEYRGAFGLTVFLVAIILLAIYTTDHVNYKLAEVLSNNMVKR